MPAIEFIRWPQPATCALWVPAINNHGGFGRWAFIEITDPWGAKNTIRAMLRGEKVDGVELVFRAPGGK